MQDQRGTDGKLESISRNLLRANHTRAHSFGDFEVSQMSLSSDYQPLGRCFGQLSLSQARFKRVTFQNLNRTEKCRRVGIKLRETVSISSLIAGNLRRCCGSHVCSLGIIHSSEGNLQVHKDVLIAIISVADYETSAARVL